MSLSPSSQRGLLMANFTYPGTAYDTPRNFLAALGSFWTRTFDAGDQVLSHGAVNAALAADNHRTLLETAATVSRFKVPIFHRDSWHAMVLLESERNEASLTLAKFDGQIKFDDGHQFDIPQTTSMHAFPLPNKLCRAGLIMNRLAEPSVLLTDGLDYSIDTVRGAIVFRDNPFDNPLIPTQAVYKDGEIVDRQLVLWVFAGDFDWQHAYTQFGYVLGLRLASSQGYKSLLNGLFSALIEGASDFSIEQALSAVTGIPLVQEAKETVEVVLKDCDAVTICTDRHAYRFSPGATPTVARGDIVSAGQSLVDSFQVYELGRGIVSDDIAALALGKGLLANCYYGDLVFENRTLPLTVDPAHPSGYTYCQFPVGGHPSDVKQFFDDIHSRGIAAAEQEAAQSCPDGRRRGTLAHLLDKRVNRTSEPIGQHLPSTINPFQFVTTEVLRANAFIVRLKTSGMGKNRLGLYNARLLKKLLPPHAAMIVIVEIDSIVDAVPPAISEQLSQFQAMNPLVDTVSDDLVSERVGVRLISGTCQ